MKVEKDYEELLKLFNKYGVKYTVIGAYAVAFYGKPRYTKDMDILIEPSIANGEKVVAALNEFGFKSLKLSPHDFAHKGKIIQLGYEPVRVDILTSIQGCNFNEVWRKRTRGTYGKAKTFFIGINELIKNKRRSKRKQDKLDLDILSQVRTQKE